MLMQEQSNWISPEPLNHITEVVTELGDINIQETSESQTNKPISTENKEEINKKNIQRIGVCLLICIIVFLSIY